MSTQISTKLAALGVALMMNGALIGAVAYLFNGGPHASTASMVQTMTASSEATSTRA
jgi:hypothetical protein